MSRSYFTNTRDIGSRSGKRAMKEAMIRNIEETASVLRRKLFKRQVSREEFDRKYAELYAHK